MGIFKRFAIHFGKSEASLLVVRVSREEHHYYSILASQNGFEYVFRNGRDRWSTISPSFAKRILELNKEAIDSRTNPMSTKDFLRMAIGGYLEDSSSWKVSKTFSYANREEALRIERHILDKSWANAEEEYDGV